MRTVSLRSTGGGLTSLMIKEVKARWPRDRFKIIFIKPGPAISSLSTHENGGTSSSSFCATSRGLAFKPV